MVHKGLHAMPLEEMDVCFVENVGNLVCPASYDVGTHLNIVLVSIPEGGDKIEKYPVMFAKADLDSYHQNRSACLILTMT